MNEELDTMLRPHAPSPLAKMRDGHQCEIDPIGIDAVIDFGIGLDPIAIDVARARLAGAKAAIDKNLFDPRLLKRLRFTQPLKERAPPRRETETLGHLCHGGWMITRRQPASDIVKSGNHATTIILGTVTEVNIDVVRLRD
jgi:hypothetical protein